MFTLRIIANRPFKNKDELIDCLDDIDVTKKFLNTLGISNEYEIIFNNQTCCYTGISLINAEKISNLQKISENFIIFDDKRIAFNINTKEDYDLLSTT